MNISRLTAEAICPFFRDIVHTKHGQFIGILCDPLMDTCSLGYDTDHIIRLRNSEECESYCDVFCCLDYEQCPYYIAMMATRYK